MDFLAQEELRAIKEKEVHQVRLDKKEKEEMKESKVTLEKKGHVAILDRLESREQKVHKEQKVVKVPGVKRVRLVHSEIKGS